MDISVYSTLLKKQNKLSLVHKNNHINNNYRVLYTHWERATHEFLFHSNLYPAFTEA